MNPKAQPVTRWIIPILLLASFLWLNGCARTKPSRFFTLNAAWVESIPDPEVTALQPSSVVLGVGPVRVPTYIDRPQIVTRLNPNEVQLSEFNRWAEPVSVTVPILLEDNLTALLPRADVTGYKLHEYIHLTHQLFVEVDDFIGTPNGEVILRAKWFLVDVTPNSTNNADLSSTIHSSTFRRTTEGAGYEGVVAAMTGLLRDLSEDIVKNSPELTAQK